MQLIKPENDVPLATYYRNDLGIFMEVENGVKAVYSDEETYRFGEFIHSDDFIRDEFDELKFQMIDFTNENPFYHREMTEEIYLA